MTFGQALAQARAYRELPRTTLALAMGESKHYAGYISSIEKEELSPGVQVVQKFAKALDVHFVIREGGWSFKPANGR